MATYYRKIKGKNYDKDILTAAEKAVKGRGDGRISLSDAKKILGMVKDSSGYTDVEKRTMQYVRDKFDFTPESDKWFRTEIRTWAAKKSTGAKTIKKAAPKKKIAGAVSKPAAAPFREEQYAGGAAVPQPSKRPEKPSGTMSLMMRILLGILIIAILLIIAMVVSPTCREQVKGRFCPSVAPQQEQAGVPEETLPEMKQPAAAPAVEQKPAVPVEEGDVYIVQVKDDLVTISEKKLGDSKRWIDIFNANRDIIQSPTLIFPGQKLKLPQAQDAAK